MLKEKEIQISQFSELLRAHPRGLTIEEISQLLPLNRNSTSKYLNRMLISGQAEMRTYGPAKVFFISKRVPVSQLLNLSSDLILILDQDLFIRYVNERLISVFGLKYQDLYAKKIDHTPFNAQVSASFLKKIAEGVNGAESQFEEEMVVQGKFLFFGIRCNPLVFEDGGRGVSLILQDVTDVKKHEITLDQMIGERTALLHEENRLLRERIIELEGASQ